MGRQNKWNDERMRDRMEGEGVTEWQVWKENEEEGKAG